MVKKRCFNWLSRYNLYCNKHGNYLFWVNGGDYSIIDKHEPCNESEIEQLKHLPACDYWIPDKKLINIAIM